MARKVLRLLVAVVLGVVTAMSVSITGYLALLESGMNQNLAAVQREVTAERSIQAQNEALGHMVTLTGSMQTRLTAMADTAEAVLTNAKAVGEANRTALNLNGVLVENNGTTATQLGQVAQALDEMNRSVKAVGGAMDDLAETASGQKEYLAGILWYVSGMNNRTPEL